MNLRRAVLLFAAEAAVVGTVAVFAVQQLGTHAEGPLTLQPGPSVRSAPGVVAVGTAAPTPLARSSSGATGPSNASPAFGAGFWGALNRNIGATGNGEARLLTDLGDAIRREVTSLLPAAPHP